MQKSVGQSDVQSPRFKNTTAKGSPLSQLKGEDKEGLSFNSPKYVFQDVEPSLCFSEGPKRHFGSGLDYTRVSSSSFFSEDHFGNLKVPTFSCQIHALDRSAASLPASLSPRRGALALHNLPLDTPEARLSWGRSKEGIPEGG